MYVHLVAERSEANNRAVCDLGWRMYIYIICKCGPGPRGSPRQQCAVVRGSIRLIERPACARSRVLLIAVKCLQCVKTLDSSKVSEEATSIPSNPGTQSVVTLGDTSVRH